MNLPSPFATSTPEQFTVRELSILLPPQFVKSDGLPGDQPVPLPLDILRASQQQGRPALRLSQIYVACPSLFIRQVQPGEDVEVVLPFQKVKRMLEPAANAAPTAMGSPFAAVAPPLQAQSVAPRGASPFVSPSSPFVQNGTPSPSPFAVRGAPSAPPPAGSPFAARIADAPGGQEVLSPFAGEGAPAAHQRESGPPNPFQRPDPVPAPAAPTSSTAPVRLTQSPFSLVSPAAPPREVRADARQPLPPSHPALRQASEDNGHEATSPQPEASRHPFEAAAEGKNGPVPYGLSSPQPVLPGHHPAPITPPVAEGPPPAIRPEPQVPAKPVLPAPAAPAQNLPKTLKVSLASLLRDVTAQDLGFDPSAVPNTVEAELSFDTILPQLATGRVEVGLEELRQGVNDRFRPAFARVRPDVRFVVPLSEIFQNLPPNAIPAPQTAEHVPINTRPFQTPFALKAMEDQSRMALPSLPRATPVPAATVAPFPMPAAPSAGVPSPIQLPSLVAVEPARGTPSLPVLPPVPPSALPAAPVSPAKLTGLPALPVIPAPPGLGGRPSPFARPPGTKTAPVPAAAAMGGTVPPQSATAPVMAPPATLPQMPAAEAHEDLGLPFSAASLRAEPPAASLSSEAFDPTRLFAGNSAFSSAPPGASAVPAPSAAPAHKPHTQSAPGAGHDISFNQVEDLSQLVLRALFMTDATLRRQEIVDRCAAFPGLRACLIIASQGVTHSGHDGASEDVRQFCTNAPRAHEYLTGLAQSMGIEGQGTFTLRSGSTIRTFFIDHGVCLAVLHAQAAFPPGVREKLILVARSLADVME